MIIRDLLVAFVCICSAITTNAQTFSKPIGSTNRDEGGASILKHPSGDYFIGGFVEDSAMIIRTNSDGTIIWAKSYDLGPNTDYIANLALTSTGHIVATGCGEGGISSSYYGFAFKIDANGTLIWQQTFKYPNHLTLIRGIKEKHNGNYLCSINYENNVGHHNSSFAELDASNGSIIWDTTYYYSTLQNGYDESILSIDQNTINKAYYGVGRYHTAFSTYPYRPIIFKLDSTGSFEWSRIYCYPAGSSGGRLYGTGIRADADSIVITIHGKDNSNSTPFDCGLIKTDLDGNPSWTRWYTSNNGKHLRIFNVINVPNGYIISGSYGNLTQDLFLIKLDKQGALLWSKYYGTPGTESVDYYQPENRVVLDGNFLVTLGWSQGFSNSKDVLLLKIDLNTGEIQNGMCSYDLQLSEISLPNYSEFFPLMQQPNLLVNLPTSPNTHSISFDNTGHLVELVTDTIVSNDTLTICNGDSVTVSADWSPSLSYLWNTGATSQQLTIAQSGSYWVDISLGGCLIGTDTVYVQADSVQVSLGNDTTLCATAATFLLTPSGSSGPYLWQDGSTGPIFNATSSGSYWVQVGNSGCTASDTINVQIVTIATPDLGNDTTLCATSMLALSPGSNYPNYLWNTNETTPSITVTTSGNYHVTVMENGCQESDSIHVSFEPEIAVDLGPDTLFCGNAQPYLLDATTQNVTYQWQDGSTSSNFEVLSSGIYWVEISNGYCSDVDSISVQFLPPPVVDLGQDILLCESASITLDAFCSGCTYAWQDGTSGPSLDVNEPGTYWVEVSLAGCTTSDSIDINTGSAPDIHVNDQVICDYEYSTVDVASPGATYQWYNGSTQAEIQLNQTGTYWVLVANMCGTDTVLFHVKSKNCFCELYVPNSFTPDGDAHNNSFGAVTDCDVSEFELIIFDRWGEELFYSNNISTFWDATYNGRLVQDGIYTWKINYAFVGEDTTTLTGHVSVLK